MPKNTIFKNLENRKKWHKNSKICKSHSGTMLRSWMSYALFWSRTNKNDAIQDRRTTSVTCLSAGNQQTRWWSGVGFLVWDCLSSIVVGVMKKLARCIISFVFCNKVNYFTCYISVLCLEIVCMYV